MSLVWEETDTGHGENVETQFNLVRQQLYHCSMIPIVWLLQHCYTASLVRLLPWKRNIAVQKLGIRPNWSLLHFPKCSTLLQLNLLIVASIIFSLMYLCNFLLSASIFHNLEIHIPPSFCGGIPRCGNGRQQLVRLPFSRNIQPKLTCIHPEITFANSAGRYWGMFPGIQKMQDTQAL